MAKILLFSLFVFLNSQIWGFVRIESPFSENMVLQRGIPVSLWGEAEPGEKVNLQMQGQLHTTIADESGKWKVTLEPLKSEFGAHLEIIGRDNRIIWKNVQVGEVWLCGGQSNMSLPVEFYKFTQTELGPINSNVYWHNAVSGGNWDAVSEKTIHDVSPTAYFFAREIQELLGIPVGILICAVSGSLIEAWMSPQSVWEDENLSWGEEIVGMTVGQFHPIIQKLAGYGIKGSIFYQGESNGFWGYKHYHRRFPALIKDWRKLWGQGDFPFLYVQLANFLADRVVPGSDDGWPTVREAQRLTLEQPNTGMASAVDIGEPDDIHPRNKLSVGKRLALLARRMAYGENGLESSGPLVNSMTFEGSWIRLRFTSIGDNLVSSTGSELAGFTLAGENNVYRKAHAFIDGKTVVVYHPEIQHPKNVRYAWADNPVVSLYNNHSLPASPFTTENGGFRRIHASSEWKSPFGTAIMPPGQMGGSVRYDLLGRSMMSEDKRRVYCIPLHRHLP